jgi:hypothetical protein
MNTGLSINDIFLRDLEFNDFDLNFTYNILLKRLKDTKTHIKHITNPVIPSFSLHINNLKERFIIKKIAVIGEINIGYICVDKNNFFGLFYDSAQLKNAFKAYPNLSKLRKEFDISEHFLLLLKNMIPKGEVFYAHINPTHTLSINSCIKVYEHVANLYALKHE